MRAHFWTAVDSTSPPGTVCEGFQLPVLPRTLSSFASTTLLGGSACLCELVRSCREQCCDRTSDFGGPISLSLYRSSFHGRGSEGQPRGWPMEKPQLNGEGTIRHTGDTNFSVLVHAHVCCAS